MTSPLSLRAQSEAIAGHLPPLLAAAERLAGTVLLGEHGRRRAGLGDDFWQYRALQPGDSRRWIDWRRSARSDGAFVRQREWQVAQTVMLWADGSAAMRFASGQTHPTKAERASVLALALALVLLRGGERVGLSAPLCAPRQGLAQIDRLAALMSEALTSEPAEEFGVPDSDIITPHARVVWVSDFLGDAHALQRALSAAADRGIRGVLLQVLDPAEETFPYRARTIFESPQARTRHETLRADGLRERYLQRLAERKAWLAEMARQVGWGWQVHHTGAPAQPALLWLYASLQQRGALR